MSNGSHVTREELARRVDLLKMELQAETQRVQILERNLDALLQRNFMLEARMSRMRAVLTVALGEDAVDVDMIKAEVAASEQGSTAATLSRALIGILTNGSANGPTQT